MSAISLRGIDHVVLRVRDLDAARRFYCDVLGATHVAYRAEFGMSHLRAGAAMIDLVAVQGKLGQAGGAAPGTEGRNMDHLCLRVEPFDQEAIVAHLARHGVPVGEIHRRFGAEGNGISIYVQDPEGNTVELKGPSGRDAPAPMSKQELEQALAHLRRGDWEAAHKIVQQDEDAPLCCWAHGIVHLMEGDVSNARYWYREAKREFPRQPSIPEEISAFAQALQD